MYADCQIFVFLLLEVIAFLQFSVAVDEGGDFQFSIFAHALQSGVLSECVFDLKVDLMNLDLEIIDLSPEVSDGLLVDIHLDLVLILSAFLFVEEEGVLGLDRGHLIVQSQEVVFEVLELEQLLFE